jgi:hypothetical protein
MAGSHVSDRSQMLAWAFLAQVEQPWPILIPLGLATEREIVLLPFSIPSLKKKNQDSMNTSIQQVRTWLFLPSRSNLISQWFVEST